MSNRPTDGLLGQNPALAQLLGLCPLLAVSTSLVNALGLALVTTFVLTSAAGLVSLLRPLTDRQLRLPLFMLTVATLVTLADQFMQAWLFGLQQRIGLFVALVVTNCTVLARLEISASRRSLPAALGDGFFMGCGFSLVLLLLGGLRELLGQASLGAGLHLLFGEAARDWRLEFTDTPGLLLAVLPPGGFILFGLLLAGYRLLIDRAGTPERPKRPEQEAPKPNRLPLVRLD